MSCCEKKTVCCEESCQVYSDHGQMLILSCVTLVDGLFQHIPTVHHTERKLVHLLSFHSDTEKMCVSYLE